MPDIKSELSKVIQQWDKADTPTTMTSATPAPKEKSGSTLATFNCIKNNPGKTRPVILDMLTTLGIKRGSSTSLLSQMVDRGNVREVEGLLYVAQDKYSCLPRRKSVVAVEPPVEAVAVAAPEPEAPTEWSASEVVDKLSVRQARAVLDELKVLFGEAV
jgi:hypothetical protein